MDFDELDNYLEDNKVDDMKIERLLSLLHTSTIDDQEYLILRQEMEEFKMFYDRYLFLYNYLMNNQLNPITHANITLMGQITTRVNKIMNQ